VIAEEKLFGIQGLVWIVMSETATKANGDRYWRSRRATVEAVSRLAKRPVAPSSIHRAWKHLEALGLISDTGLKDTSSGARVWRVNYEKALEAYARLDEAIRMEPPASTVA